MTTKVGFLLFPGFPMACLTSVIEPLRAANEISQTSAFEWTLIAEKETSVLSSAGIPFEPQLLLEAATGFDYLILLSAPSGQFADPRGAAIVRRLGRFGCTLGAISGGVFALVRSGAVRGERISVHWCYEAAFSAEFPDVPSSDQVIEVSGRCVTASGAAAAFDLALGFIDAALGTDVATEVACWFQHPMMRKIGVKQSVPAHLTDSIQDNLPPVVSKAIALFAADLSNPVSVNEIADHLHISSRHLTRSFKQATGQNPTTYFRWLRMKAARQIVMYTNDAIADVAGAVGFASARHFTGHYRAEFGVSPQEDRQRINLHRTEGNRPVPSV